MERHTRQFLIHVLVIFIPVAIRGDVGARFGVAHVLHLVGILFDADLAEVAPCAEDCRHGEEAVGIVCTWCMNGRIRGLEIGAV